MYNTLETELRLYYYGARYYDPRTSVSFGVDPLADIYPAWSPFTYTLDNPIRFIDPDGMGPGDHFKTIKMAAIDFAKTYNGISILENREYGSSFYKIKIGNNVFFTYSPPAPGGSGKVIPSTPPSGFKTLATIHTHGCCIDINSKEPNDDGFSRGINGDIGDIDIYKLTKRPGYVSLPNGRLLMFDPKKPNQLTLVSDDIPSDPNDPSRKNNISPYTKPPRSATNKGNNRLGPKHPIKNVRSISFEK
ncbi:MAG: DUF4329 domain-containing protein [Bacteroidetes bacterium]|nr:DUF4329 domain-containing protein [Bacteroidota bacterium]